VSLNGLTISECSYFLFLCVGIFAGTGMLWSILPDTEEFTAPYIYQHQIRRILVLKIILKWKLTKHKTYTGNHLTPVSRV